MSSASARAAGLLNDPILARSNCESLSRMLRNVHEQRFKSGDVIYRAHADADFMYLLQEGTVELVSPAGTRLTIDSTRFGEEAATDVPQYLSDAVAVSEVLAFSIPRTSLAGLNQYNPGHKAEFYFSLLSNFGGQRIQRGVTQDVGKHGHSKDKKRAAGWFAAILLPLMVLYFGKDLALPRETTVFLAIFAATVTMWVFELVDEYIPGLFAVLVTLALSLAPPKIVLGGFASDGFFMAMSILGLGTVVVLSGLSFRFLLWLLRYLPNNVVGHNFGIMLTGLLLTPIVPSINGRAVLVAPFLIDMVETLKFEFKGKAATRLAITAFTGATLLSACFMTSRSVNYVIFGLLSPQQQEHFQWLYWAFAAAGAAAAMLLVYCVSLLLVFPSSEVSKLSKAQVDVQLTLLGKIKNREWAAIAGVLIFAVGVVTVSIHTVKPPWIGMAILFVLLMFGSLSKIEFREKTDWPSLVYLGTLVGIINVFNYFDLDKIIGLHLAGLGDIMRTDFKLFVAILFGVVLLMRFVMPGTATVAVCATVFMPLAGQAGINPWVIGFILLLFADVWLFPYQCSYYQQFQAQIRAKGVYDETAFLKFNLFMNLVRLGSVYASLPFWTSLGLV